MAPRKKTVQKKSTARAKSRSARRAGRSSRRNKGLGIILFAVVLLVAVIQISNYMNGETVKPYKVQQLLKVAGEDYPCGHFSAWGIAPIVGKDLFVISDAQFGRLLYFDLQGKYLRSVCKAGKGRGPLELDEPSGMCNDSMGNVYVTDTWGGAIKGFNANGDEILNLDLVSIGKFYSPRGCGFDGQHFVVADTGTSRVVLVSEDGSQVTAWDSHGSAPGQFNNPMDAAADGKGNYFIADSGNKRLQWLDSKGKAKKIFKYNVNPNAVCVDKAGRIYVALGAPGDCVKLYDSNGKYLGDLVDQKGSGEPFRGVMGIAVNPDNVLMITTSSTATLFKVPPAS